MMSCQKALNFAPELGLAGTDAREVGSAAGPGFPSGSTCQEVLKAFNVRVHGNENERG
jgi:hypothetical protein